jgi:hypothetical protein
MQRRFLLFMGLFAIVAMLTGPALAYHPTFDDGAVDSARDVHGRHQHGGDEGHLPASSENVELVGKLELTDEPSTIADVGVFGNFAYLAALANAACTDRGVYVVDVADPVSPEQVSFIPTTEGSYVGEGVQVITVDTQAFRGDLLVHNNEICGEEGKGGVSLWDVTDPHTPQPLALHVGDDTDDDVVNQIHSAFAWETGTRAFVVLVDDEEATDVDILEITDPRKPVLLVETGLEDWPDAQNEQAMGIGTFPASFFHDVQVKRFGGHWVMLLSYWDAGWVLLNVDDPANPTFIADTDYLDPDPLTGFSPPEGNAHQAEFDSDFEFIIGTDEDFSPYRVMGQNTTDNTEFPAGQGSDTPPLDADTSLSGTTVFVGRACNDDPAVPPAPSGVTNPIAVVERGVCFFTEKVANVEAAGGYVGVIIMNREGADACASSFGMTVEGNLPVVSVGRDVGFAFFDASFDEAACLAGDGSALAPIEIGTVGDEVRFTAAFDGWGYVHLFDARTLEEIDAYAVEEALDPEFASGFGALSVHEVATDPTRNIGYLSYYNAGLRVIKFNENGIREVGHYIAEGGNNFWGVEAVRRPDAIGGMETLIFASDMDSGLWIFRYTGD